jgi:prepilin-type N-terminal cleavage/methylation domain-containing protein
VRRVRESCRGGRAGRNSLRFAGDTPAATTAFTLIELLVVIAIIVVLAGLVLSTVGYVQKKGARSRAETEIAAMSAACESYKADNAVYPRPLSTTPNSTTDVLDARAMGVPTTTNYTAASLVLYRALSGDRSLDRMVDAADKNLDIDGSTLGTPLSEVPRSYYAFKPNQLSPTDGQSVPVQYVRDPFGNSYGYSTANQADPTTPKGYNPTFDLWSTAGLTDNPPSPDTITPQWIKNW